MKWKNEALVGLVVIAGILTALAGAVWLSGRSMAGDEREITATFLESDAGRPGPGPRSPLN